MELLKYIISGEKPTSHNEDIEVIDKIVSQVKQKSEVTKSFMQQWDREEHIRRDTETATKENDAKIHIRLSRKHNISDEDIRTELRDEFGLSEDTIKGLFEQTDEKV